jgi:hypothetical protein
MGDIGNPPPRSALPLTGIPVHKFHVGQTVQFHSDADRLAHAAPGSYSVTRQLPARDGEFEYRIKTSNGAPERVAAESQLASPKD